MQKRSLSASILSADILNLQKQVEELEEGGVDMLHIDVMDGAFVPNLGFSISSVEALKKITKLPLDVHLMMENPERHIQAFVDAGSDILTVHLEAVKHIDRTIRQIKNFKIKAGVALLPSSLPQNLEYIIDIIDLVLVMSVNPGFGGQTFIQSQLNKISYLSSKMQANTLLSVDGGVNIRNISQIADAGANTFVVGSYLYKDGNIQQNIQNIKSLIM
ncbi:rpe ribulose-phosphate 3-epimerase [Candidatus Phycorickettsia trachydisci]|uniref:Ribulose-phosphate 3-epimerase n=1 Tax=Candidatus Phycorickettsia trachydisci TaxID=2115978 RepID=A0A2P1P834_9RICK|nr:ribulose-phosphate 3-epimerase [Candidatus Phycorickettsia trachydisci]AVP87438.1 rpe ribulose-phosphate 3-epimerase [Candidatus Phycorickettsia trachydisci]